MFKILEAFAKKSSKSIKTPHYLLQPKICFSNSNAPRPSIEEIPMLNDFVLSQSLKQNHDNNIETIKNNKQFYIETYGCQMNESDSEIINSILTKAGYTYTKILNTADIVLINTCAIREGAENRIWGRLSELRALKSPSRQPLVLGVLGCMAERLKEKLLEKAKVVDLIAGPDAYRDLPSLLLALEGSKKSINVQLSIDETYADIKPIRFKENSPHAYVSIMRGCNNMCSFCIVPFTRGRERSRPLESILDEIKGLRDQGVKEITFLGQNVNTYHDITNEQVSIPYENTPGFGETFKLRKGDGWRFESLLQKAAEQAPGVRFRFTSPHPKNFPQPVLEVIKSYDNICKQLHLPAQSGSSTVLSRMRRNYSKEAYFSLIERVREMIPEIAISTDMIVGFCGETEEEFNESLELMRAVEFDQAYLFAYSMREKTHAHRNYKDDVTEDVKMRRLRRIIEVFHEIQAKLTKREEGRLHLVLVEKPSGNKYPGQFKGRTDTNKRVLIMQEEIPVLNKDFNQVEGKKKTIGEGDFVLTEIESTSTRSLFGKPIGKMSIMDFAEISKKKPFISKEISQEIKRKFNF